MNCFLHTARGDDVEPKEGWERRTEGVDSLGDSNVGLVFIKVIA